MGYSYITDARIEYYISGNDNSVDTVSIPLEVSETTDLYSIEIPYDIKSVQQGDKLHIRYFAKDNSLIPNEVCYPANDWFIYDYNIVGVKSNDNNPYNYGLNQNYPNPFNPETTFKFSLKEAGNTKLAVYNILGQEVAILVNNNLSAGNHEIKFDASALTSGMYVYRIESGSFTDTKKMLLLK